MKPHITNLDHQKFCMLIENAIRKMEEIPGEEKFEVPKKVMELKNNKQQLDDIYVNYQDKLKELRQLLDEYERVHQTSRIHLRKTQLWLKYTCSKVLKNFSC